MLKSGKHKKEIMIDESTYSIAGELLRERGQKKLAKEKEHLLLTDAKVMDKIISNLMSDLKLL